MKDSDALRDLRAYARFLLAEEVGVPPAPRPAATPVPVRRALLRPRTIAAAAAILVLGNAGLAAAADGAVPGDLLYPVDRAYESIGAALGFHVGGSAERLDEAQVLLERGNVSAAIETAAATLGDGLAAEALELTTSADDPTTASAPDGGEDLQAAVGALIEAIRSDDKDDIKQAARTVAETARGEPFDADQGPGKDSGDGSPPTASEGDEHRTVPDLPDAAVEHRSNPAGTVPAPDETTTTTTTTIGDQRTGNPGNGNGPPDNPGNGNGPPDNPGNGNGPPDNPGNGQP
jgi:hypothetical protein